MATHETREKGHSSFGSKFKGAGHVFHGLGEDIRGSVMGTVESLGGSEEAKAREEDIVAKGRSEIEQGIAQMKGAGVSGGTTAGPEHHVEGKVGEQLQKQPAEKVVGSQTLATPPVPGTAQPARTDDPQSLQAKPEISQQELGGKTSAPPSLGSTQPVHMDDPQSLQAERETGRQEPTTRTGTENVQQSI